jgi:hypothetical protein
MSQPLDLTDLLEKEEVERIYRRGLTDKEWENICFNLKTKHWSKVRKDMIYSLENSPDYFLKER